MKLRWCHGALALFVLVSSLRAQELTPAEALKNLENTAASQPSGGDILHLISSWKKDLEEENYATLSQADVVGGGAIHAGNEALRAELAVFASAVRRVVRERKEAEVKNVEALLAQAGDAVEKARTAEDLDAILKALTATKPRFFDEGGQNLQRQTEASRQIVAAWQTYLIEKEAGKADRARASLQNVADYLSRYPLIPRSKVLRLLSESTQEEKPGVSATTGPPPYTGPTSDSIQKRFDEDGDIDAALKALDELPDNIRSFGSNLSGALKHLKKFKESGSSMSLEEAAKAFSDVSYRSPVLASYNAEMNKLIAAAWKVPAPSKPVTTERYVLTIIQDATARDDWSLAQKGWALAASLRFSIRGDDSAISHYLKGLEFEKVGMWVQAVRAYRSGLNSKLIYMPIGKFTSRLEAMNKADPKRYEQAITEADTLDRLEKVQMLGSYHRLPQATTTRSDEMTEIIRQELRTALEERKPSDAVPKTEPVKPAPAPVPAPAPE